MKKKLLSLCLALALCAGLTVPAMAGVSTEGNDPRNEAWSAWLEIDHIQSTETVPDEDGIPQQVLHTTAPTTVKVLYETSYPDLGSSVVKRGDENWTRVEVSTGSCEDGTVSAGSTYVLEEGTYFLFDPAASACIYIEVSGASAEPEKPTTPAAPSFTDVPAGAYYADAVKWAVANGITTGKTATTFAPNETCTRAQIMTFLYRAAGSPKPQAEGNPYTDVSPEAYYYKACQWAYDDIGAVISKQFYPNDPCTRSTAVQFIWSASEQPEVTGGCPFTDVEQDDFMSGVINWAVKQGITQGKTATTFAPNETCTRAQIVTFLYRAFA